MFQVLAPCGLGDFVCGRASEWVSNGTELCNAAGFSVNPLADPEESSCYGGKGSLDYIANSMKTSRSEIFRREQNTWSVQDFKQLITDMPFSETISWAVGGMVLTAGLLFARLAFFLVMYLYICIYLCLWYLKKMGKNWELLDYSTYLGIAFSLISFGFVNPQI